MPDSVKVQNSNAEDGAAESKKDFRRKLAYDPAVLKRQKLWSKDQLDSKDQSGRVFSRVGAPGSANGKDSLVGTMTSHQGDRKANPPDSKHSEGNTQKYNAPSESRVHTARSNNEAGIQDNAPSSSGAAASYPSQSLSGGGKGLDDATKGRSYGGYSDSSADYGSRSHGSRTDNGGQGVSDRGSSAGRAAVMYMMQPALRKRAGLSNTPDSSAYDDTTRHHGGQANPAPPRNDGDPGLVYNSDSRSHVAHDQHENRSVKLSRADNTLNRRSL
jgi:hypothetical protein